MILPIKNKDNFIQNFLNPVSRLNSSATLKICDNISTIVHNNSNIFLKAIYDINWDDHPEEGTLCLPDTVRLIKILSCLDESNIHLEIEKNHIIYKNYYNISVAIGTERGLVVPVLKKADELSFADIEKNIFLLSEKAKQGKITINDLQGGTFTISNGGIYGSMLSTPILNPPQTGILGMHNIVDRPVVKDGSVVIRPIMYLALSYDHRIIDGREAVSFLKTIKECLEEPRRLFLDL